MTLPNTPKNNLWPFLATFLWSQGLTRVPEFVRVIHAIPCHNLLLQHRLKELHVVLHAHPHCTFPDLAGGPGAGAMNQDPERKACESLISWIYSI